MLNGFHGLLKLLEKQHTKKLRALHRICLKWTLWKSFIFLIFFLKICCGGCSWYSACTDFQEICYSTAQSLSDALKLESNIRGTPSCLFSKSTNENHVFDFEPFEFSCRLFYPKYEASNAKTYAARFLRDWQN